MEKQKYLNLVRNCINRKNEKVIIGIPMQAKPQVSFQGSKMLKK